MKYITHRRYKKISAIGKQLNIPYGTELEAKGNFIITPKGELVCYATSENAKLHFARNDDMRGLERGKLTYAIAYANRRKGKRFRFSDSEIELLERDWAHFLRQDVDMMIFNEDFFAADVDELQRLADALKIKVGR